MNFENKKFIISKLDKYKQYDLRMNKDPTIKNQNKNKFKGGIYARNSN